MYPEPFFPHFPHTLLDTHTTFSAVADGMTHLFTEAIQVELAGRSECRGVGPGRLVAVPPFTPPLVLFLFPTLRL